MKRRDLLLCSASLTLADLMPAAVAATPGERAIPPDWAPRLKHLTDEAGAPLVRFVRGVDSRALLRLYEATGFRARGKLGVKVTFEAPGGPHVDTALIAPLVKRLQGTLIDCNGFTPPRNRTDTHLEAARANGFYDVAPIDILDADGDKELPVSGGKWLKAARTGAHLSRYDAFLVITRFKAHHLPFYGGVLKSLSICMGSIAGKARIHSCGETDAGYRDRPDRDTLEAMADAAKGAVDYFGDRALYIGVMQAFEPDDGDAEARDLGDVGIFASTDPVALDQVFLDLAYGAAPTPQTAARWREAHGASLTDHAQAVGVGSTRYRLSEVA